MQWLENDFLGHLAEWDSEVQGREEFTMAEKKIMMLSQDTLEGLCMTGTHALIFIVTLFIFRYFI